MKYLSLFSEKKIINLSFANSAQKVVKVNNISTEAAAIIFTVTNLWVNIADGKLIIFFLFFLLK